MVPSLLLHFSKVRSRARALLKNTLILLLNHENFREAEILIYHLLKTRFEFVTNSNSANLLLYVYGNISYTVTFMSQLCEIFN